MNTTGYLQSHLSVASALVVVKTACRTQRTGSSSQGSVHESRGRADHAGGIDESRRGVGSGHRHDQRLAVLIDGSAFASPCAIAAPSSANEAEATLV